MIQFEKKSTPESLLIVSLETIGAAISQALATKRLHLERVIIGCFSCLDRYCWDCSEIRDFRNRFKGGRSTGICIGCGLPDSFDNIKIHENTFGIDCGISANVFGILMIYRKSTLLQRQVQTVSHVNPPILNKLEFFKWCLAKDYDNDGLFNGMKVLYALLSLNVLPFTRGKIAC